LPTRVNPSNKPTTVASKTGTKQWDSSAERVLIVWRSLANFDRLRHPPPQFTAKVRVPLLRRTKSSRPGLKVLPLSGVQGPSCASPVTLPMMRQIDQAFGRAREAWASGIASFTDSVGFAPGDQLDGDFTE